MKNRNILAILIGASVLTSCQNQPIVEISFGNTKDILINSNITGKFIANDPELIREIQKNKSTVIVPSDDVLAQVAGKTDTHVFLSSSAGKIFVKQHILLTHLAEDGTYTNMAGSSWKTVRGNGSILKTVNGVPIEGCAEAIGDSANNIQVSNWLCRVNSIIPF